MSTCPEPVHPELRLWGDFVPHFNYHRGNYRLIRRLIHLIPPVKTPAGVCIETICISSPDPGRSIRLRIYRPRSSTAPAPGLVWMHGGGMVTGRPETDDPLLIPLVQELGLVVVSVDYCLAPEHPFPAPLEDCCAALQWTYARAQDLNVDPDRIAVGGNSAGGGLAAALAQWAHDLGEVRPIFQLLIYPMLDDRTCLLPAPDNLDRLVWTPASNRFGWEAYLGRMIGQEPIPPYAVPARRENLSGLPPAWIGVGTLDLFYDENLAYAEKLRKCGVDCELKIVPGAYHGFDVLRLRSNVVADFREAQIAALRRAFSSFMSVFLVCCVVNLLS